MASPVIVSLACPPIRPTRSHTSSPTAMLSRLLMVMVALWSRCPVVPRWVSSTVCTEAKLLVSTSWVSGSRVMAAMAASHRTTPEEAVSAYQMMSSVMFPDPYPNGVHFHQPYSVAAASQAMPDTGKLVPLGLMYWANEDARNA